MQKIKYYLTKLFSDPQPQPVTPGAVPEIKIPFLRIVLDPYSLFFDHVKQFFMIGLLVALAMTVLTLGTGQGYLCIYPQYSQQGFCTSNVWLFGLVRLLNIFLVAYFMVKWYQSAFAGQKISRRFLQTFDKPVVKTFAGLVAFLVLSLVSALSMYLLYARVPNPDWRIELVYFAFVSLGFFVPFVLVRFYSVLGFLMSGEAVPPLKKIWRHSAGNMLRLLISIGFLFFIGLFSLFAFMNNFRVSAEGAGLGTVFIVEYLYNLLLLLLLAFFANHCYLQQIYLFGRKDHGQ